MLYKFKIISYSTISEQSEGCTQFALVMSFFGVLLCWQLFGIIIIINMFYFIDAEIYNKGWVGRNLSGL